MDQSNFVVVLGTLLPPSMRCVPRTLTRRERCVGSIGEDGTLIELAQWLAPSATMISAMMTAVNLGARITGRGFGVFTVGSIAWTIGGCTSGQTSLIITIGFLTVINLVGVWRWLGRQRTYEDDGMPKGKAVEEMIERSSGRASYVVVAITSVAGIAEQLRPVSRDVLESITPSTARNWPISTKAVA